MSAPSVAMKPLDIPPAPPGHAFRWRRVFQKLREVRSAEDPVQAGIELVDAVGGMDGERIFQEFAGHPEGRRMLRERPDLIALLGDREALAALPDGSLGRAYLAFAEENGFAADGLVQQNRAAKRETRATDPYRRWFFDRYTMTHDVWHVVTGNPTTPEGEGRLLWFSYAQRPTRGFLVLVMLVTFSAGFDWTRQRSHLRAWRAGKRARDLSTVRWEEFLAWPLDELRACFGIEEPRA